MTRRARAFYFVSLSVIAALLLLIIFSVGSGRDHTIGYSDKILVGVAFIASCFLCLSMTISPNWARKVVERSSPSRTEGNHRTSIRRYRGHHPDCVNFQSHRISMGNLDLCSGCLGLMAGAAASIALMMVYLGSIVEITRNMSVATLAVGLCAISIACVETVLEKRNPVVHLLANSTMIVGFFLLVVGMLEATGSGAFGLLAVSFSFLWMDTRIQLSLWRHSQVCEKCSDRCKMY